MNRSPADRIEDGPAGRMRRDILSGAVLPEAQLLRFVAAPDGRIVVDVAAKLPGRGLWLRAARESVEQAAAKGAFSRAARVPLKTEPGLADQAEARLAERMLAGLGLARRAGMVLLGFEAIERALRAGPPPAVLVEAADGAADGIRKLQAAAGASGCAPFVIGCFSSAELSLALGRANVVHAAVKPGRMAERLIFDAGRISGFRPLRPWRGAGFSPESKRRARGRGPLARVEGEA